MKSTTPLAQWLAATTSAAHSGILIKLSLTKPTPQAESLKSIDIRPILVKKQLKLSFTYHHKTNDIVKNYSPEEASPLLSQLVTEAFTVARLSTTQAELHLTRTGKTFSLARHAATQTEAPSLAHDRAKNRLLDSSSKPYLHALGITDANGNVLKAAQDKFRQINKYIETLSSLLESLPKKPHLSIVDMGSGKGYLTFALYDYLTTTLGLKVTVTGVEYRPELVKLCNDIAREQNMNSLYFIQGSIAEFDCTDIDIVIALHACDTATDDALAKAIKGGASLIVVAPCCHKQVRRQLDKAPAHRLSFLTEYGTHTERLAEMLTDNLRAQLLALHGYTTNLFEFIAGEHTPKNVMITALRRTTPLPAAEKSRLAATIAAAKAEFGITTHQLEKLLG